MWKWSDVWPSMVTHTRNLCSAFNPSKCTHTAVNTHTPWTHTRSSGQPGEQLGVRCLAQVSHRHGIEGGESNNSCRTWDSNLWPSGYKSDSLSIRPRLPHVMYHVSCVLVRSLRVQCSRALNTLIVSVKDPMRSSIRICPSSREMSDKCCVSRFGSRCCRGTAKTLIVGFVGLRCSFRVTGSRGSRAAPWLGRASLICMLLCVESLAGREYI